MSGGERRAAQESPGRCSWCPRVCCSMVGLSQPVNAHVWGQTIDHNG
jgi:hypothetical protein